MISGHRRSLQNLSSPLQPRSQSRSRNRPMYRGLRLPQLKGMIGINQGLARVVVPPIRLSRLGKNSRRKLTANQLKQRVEDLIDSCNRSLSRSPSLPRQSSFAPLSDYRAPRKLMMYDDIKRILRDDESKTLRLSINATAYGE